MTPHQQQVTEYFNHTHEDYCRLWGADRHLCLHCGYFDEQHRGHDEAVTNMNRVLASLARVSCTDRVLDAGSGLGGSAIWLARNLGCRVAGVNINARQVALARQYAPRRHVEGLVQFHIADFADTGLAAESFDLIWALESMCYAEDTSAFLAEARRLLQPGGRLVIADGFLAREHLQPEERRLVERWRQGWALGSILSIRQFRQRLSAAGFHQIRFCDATRHVAPSSKRIYRTTLFLYPFALFLHWIGLRTAIQTRGIVSGYYQYRLLKRGLGVYGIFYAEKQSCSCSESQVSVNCSRSESDTVVSR